MIRCNLAILLAERNLKITKVSSDTGISRTTLTSLANNRSQGIQFDTINTLCNYLRVSPFQLISYVSTDIKITNTNIENELLTIDLKITENLRSYNCSLTGYCYTYFTDNQLCDLDIIIELYDEELNNNDKDLKKENSLIIEAFTTLTVPFRNDLQEEILKNILNEFDENIISDSLSVSFTWDDKLTAEIFPF